MTLFTLSRRLHLGALCKPRPQKSGISTTNAVTAVSVALCFSTYCIMANWIYNGYVDLWYGVYGLDDDDD
ncbi:hypothetical protein LSM04_000359 [Trypanosoma melophagium]|uniref:uncharacterized protein n=1 Tax=Trypanosoma melophagium TaxID=715481 RepID=UPI00351A7E5F|nr:hypothetical protein LSM04_000359 [Trypanosoma melophagium]